MGLKHGELDLVEGWRSELIGYCYRMMGSIFEAEDAVQDTMLRVWKGRDQLREDAAGKAWVYRIATNVCLDKLRGARRRVLPMDLSEPAAVVAEPKDRLPQTSWIWPISDAMGNPADIVINREAIRLSFIAMLQTLPPRQRAVLILCDVFRWPAKQTADALEMTVAAVNSALQRSRSTMAGANLRTEALQTLDDEADRELLDRYVEAFERYDIDALLTLFQESGSLSMPPFVMWVSGRTNMASFYQTTHHHCLGSRLLPLRVNGCPAYAHYVPDERGEALVPWCIQVLETDGGKLAHLHHFIDPGLFERFGMPAKLDPRKDAATDR